MSNGQEVQSSAFDLMLSTLLDDSVAQLSVNEVSEHLSDYYFLDARSEEEYNVSHLPSALWIGYEHFDDNRIESLEKTQPIIVYCSVGYRSEKIAKKLLSLGFSEVYNLYGGIFEWVNQSQPIVDSQETNTNKVHAYDLIWGIWLDRGEKVYGYE
ncbi:MAG: rhodanese-like domain-containing protein [Salibacteraceae bacterium]